MKLATTTSDIKRFFNKGSDICEMLPYLKQCGFKYIDLCFAACMFKDSPMCSDNWETWAYEIGNTAAKLGLSLVQAHSSDAVYEKGEARDYSVSMLKRQIAICNMLGIKGTVIHAVCTDNGTREDFIAKNAELYIDLLKTAEAQGVEIYTENTCTKNCPTYFLITADDFYALKEKIGDNPYFGICWDVGHAHIEGVNQYKEITALKDNLKALHIHDNNSFGDTHIMPYLGTISMDEIMNALIDMGYNGNFTLESDTSLRPANYWQGNRKRFEGKELLLEPPFELALKLEEANYICGKHILTQYNCFDNDCDLSKR